MFEKFFKKEKKREEPRIPVDQLHRDFVRGVIGQQELFRLLSPADLKAFGEYHKSARGRFEGSGDRKIIFKLGQLDNLVDGDLEKRTLEAHGERVIERWDKK